MESYTRIIFGVRACVKGGGRGGRRMEAATTRRSGHRGVFVYMPTRGINLYPVKPAAASIQRLLVSLFGYLANENYDLTSTRFYCITGTLVFPSPSSFVHDIFSRLRLPSPRRKKPKEMACPSTLSRSRLRVRNIRFSRSRDNSTCSNRYLSRSSVVAL